MAILAPHTSPNWVPGNYFRVNKAEFQCQPDRAEPRWEISLAYYVSEAARQQNPKDPVWVYYIHLTVEEGKARGLPDPREAFLYDIALSDQMFLDTNAAPDVPAPDPE